MEKYIGTKLIQAELMSKEEFYKIGDSKNGICPKTLGYKVVYPDGYVSWSPKDVFEAAYRANGNLSFGMAFEALKKGYVSGMRLPSWKPDVIIRIQRPDEHSKMTAPYLYVESRFGKVPWKETMIELFSEQWEVVE
jgi:hypothetical protein